MILKQVSRHLIKSPSSLSDLKEIGCKSVWLVYISPLFRPIEQLLAFKIVKIYPHPVIFSLRFFKSDRLLAGSDISGHWKVSITLTHLPDQGMNWGPTD